MFKVDCAASNYQYMEKFYVSSLEETVDRYGFYLYSEPLFMKIRKAESMYVCTVLKQAKKKFLLEKILV